MSLETRDLYSHPGQGSINSGKDQDVIRQQIIDYVKTRSKATGLIFVSKIDILATLKLDIKFTQPILNKLVTDKVFREEKRGNAYSFQYKNI